MIVRHALPSVLAVCQVAVSGVCQTQDGVARAITAVLDEQGLQVNVCKSCLTEKLRRQEWEWDLDKPGGQPVV